jgi:phage tail sheath gpL-like
MTLSLNQAASAQGTQTREASFRSVVTALEAQMVLGMQYDQTKTTIVEDTFQRLTTPAATGAKYGYNTQMYLSHLKAYLASGGNCTVWGVPLAQPATSNAAAGTATITVGTPVAGTLPFYVCGNRFTVGVVATDTATTLAAKIVAIVNAATYIGFTAANVDEVITFTATWEGTSGNQGRLFFGPWRTGDTEIPSGVSIAVVQPTGETGEEDTTLANLWAGMLAASIWRTDVVTPSNTTAAMDAATNAIGSPDVAGAGTGLWLDQKYQPCTNWVGSIETDLTTITALGDGRKNDSNTVIACSPDAMEFPFEIAASVAGYVARSANNNPATKYQGASMSNVLLGALDEANDWTRDPVNANVNTAVRSGITPIITDDNGATILGDVATTWHPDGASFPPFQFEVGKRKTWNMSMTAKNDKMEFKNDVIVESVSEADEQDAAVDIDMERGRIAGLAEGWQRFGWAYNKQFTISNMEVTQDPINPDRFNRKIPVLLSGNKRVESDVILVDRNISIANDKVIIAIS